MREFNFSIWNDKEMGPMLTMSALMEAITGASRGGGETAALYSYALSFDDGTSLTKEDYLVEASGGYSVAIGIMSDLGVLMNNPYKRLLADKVDLKMEIADRFPQALIESADVDQPFYRPGSQVKLTWRLQPYRKPLQVMSHTFRLPDNIADGEYEVVICDSSSRSMLESSRNPGGDRVVDFESLLRVIRRNFPANKVYAAMQDQDTGVAVHGSELPKLPSSVIETIRSTSEPAYVAPVEGNLIMDADFATAYEIQGSESVTVVVNRYGR